MGGVPAVGLSPSPQSAPVTDEKGPSSTPGVEEGPLPTAQTPCGMAAQPSTSDGLRDSGPM